MEKYGGFNVLNWPSTRSTLERQRKSFFFFFFVQTIKTEARLNAGTYTIFIFSLLLFFFFKNQYADTHCLCNFGW